LVEKIRGQGEGAGAVTSGLWCRRLVGYSSRVAWLAVWLVSGCADQPVAPAGQASAASAVEAQSAAESAGAAPDWTADYYGGYLDEVLLGRVDDAAAAYRGVMNGADARAPALAARAALRLAELEARVGQRREAIELVARARALGGRDPEVVAWADRLATRLASVRSRPIAVRGPPIGTLPAGLDDGSARRFADAEKLLGAFYSMEVKPRLEDLSASVRERERALKAAARAYQAVIDERVKGTVAGAAAEAAAEMRVGSLHHDLAISLVFDLPPELEARARERQARKLRAQALSSLRRARDAYRRSLGAAADVDDDRIERWSRAARKELDAVEDLLRGG